MKSPACPIRSTLVGMALMLLGSCGDGASDGDGPARPHLLIIGWDGATFEMLDPMVRDGNLPNLAKLQKRGASAVLESTAIPISSAAWTAAMTGVGPGENGVYGFFEPVPNSYDVRLVDSTCNQAPPLWRILAMRDRSVHVFGVPLTWPPEPIPGVMVSGMLSPPDGTYTWPGTLAEELRTKGFLPDIGVWHNAELPTRERVIAQLGLKERAIVRLLEPGDWDAAVIVFKSLDVVSHLVYDGRTDSYVAQVLERLDEALGKILAAAGPNTDVLLISDHGFASYPLNFDLHAWLLEQGFAAPAADAPERDKDQRGPLVEERPRAQQRRISSLDLTKTMALAGECEGNFGSIRLNLAGREPQGTVDPRTREEALVRIEKRLLEYAPAGTPLVEEVWRGNQLYPGGAPAVPDLIFRVREDHLVTANDGAAVLSKFRAPRPDHDRSGVLLAAGPNIAAESRRRRFSILDVTPTALHLMGLAVHGEMRGTVRTELAKVARPVVRVPRSDDGDLQRADSGHTTDMSREQAEAAMRRLQTLGYADGVEQK